MSRKVIMSPRIIRSQRYYSSFFWGLFCCRDSVPRVFTGFGRLIPSNPAQSMSRRTPGSGGYRVEGRHLSQNFTVFNGKIADTPSFFGSNPAEVREGPHKELGILAAEEDLARDLLESLTPDQKNIAIVTDKAYLRHPHHGLAQSGARGAALRPQPSCKAILFAARRANTRRPKVENKRFSRRKRWLGEKARPATAMHTSTLERTSFERFFFVPTQCSISLCIISRQSALCGVTGQDE